jgi:hypothetical protein
MVVMCDDMMFALLLWFVLLLQLGLLQGSNSPLLPLKSCKSWLAPIFGLCEFKMSSENCLFRTWGISGLWGFDGGGVNHTFGIPLSLIPRQLRVLYFDVGFFLVGMVDEEVLLPH